MSIVADSPATVIPNGTWSIDPVWSALEFEIQKLGLVTVKGRVPGFSGTIQGGETPSTSQAPSTPPASRPSTRPATGTCSRRSSSTPSAIPELRFESTAVRARGDELVVEGELTIKDVTKPVTLTGSFVGAGVDPYGNERIGIELAGTVDRTDFGLAWNAPLPGGGFLLPNEVVLKANLAAVRTG